MGTKVANVMAFVLALASLSLAYLFWTNDQHGYSIILMLIVPVYLWVFVSTQRALSSSRQKVSATNIEALFRENYDVEPITGDRAKKIHRAVKRQKPQDIHEIIEGKRWHTSLRDVDIRLEKMTRKWYGVVDTETGDAYIAVSHETDLFEHPKWFVYNEKDIKAARQRLREKRGELNDS